MVAEPGDPAAAHHTACQAVLGQALPLASQGVRVTGAERGVTLSDSAPSKPHCPPSQSSQLDSESEHETFHPAVSEDVDGAVYSFAVDEVKPVKMYKRDAVVGVENLRDCLPFWEAIGANKFVLNIIANGYCLPFISVPPPTCFPNHASVRKHSDFVSDSVQDLLDRGCVVEASNMQDVMVCSPLGVVDNGKKLRLILDLRFVNKHLAKHKFKLEDIKVVENVYKQGDYIVTFDLKSGYHHISIAQDFQRFLAFKWPVGGVERVFMFAVLPFGLSTAPYVFTKVTRVLLRRWRAMGFRCQLYIDDGRGGGSSFEEALQVGNVMKEDLVRAGFVPHEEKSKWVPSQQACILGMDFDFEAGTITVSKRRLHKFKALLYQVLTQARPLVRDLAKVAGHLMSMHRVLAGGVRLRTRGLYALIDTRRSWFSAVSWTPQAREELQFWTHMIDELKCAPLWESCPVVNVLSWSDASDTGWGGYVQLASGETVSACGMWEGCVQDAHLSSTWRELRAVAYVLKSMAVQLSNRTCLHRSDNQAAVHIIQYGSKKPHLQEEALAIERICNEHNMKLIPVWVPREENELADYYSKLVDQDDWQVCPLVFQSLDMLWGPHTLDSVLLVLGQGSLTVIVLAGGIQVA